MQQTVLGAWEKKSFKLQMELVTKVICDQEELRDVQRSLRPCQLEDVSFERSANGICGHIGCGLAPRPQKGKKWNVDRKNERVWDQEELNRFCSKLCYTSYKKLSTTLVDEPAWNAATQPNIMPVGKARVTPIAPSSVVNSRNNKLTVPENQKSSPVKIIRGAANRGSAGGRPHRCNGENNNNNNCNTPQFLSPRENGGKNQANTLSNNLSTTRGNSENNNINTAREAEMTELDMLFPDFSFENVEKESSPPKSSAADDRSGIDREHDNTTRQKKGLVESVLQEAHSPVLCSSGTIRGGCTGKIPSRDKVVATTTADDDKKVPNPAVGSFLDSREGGITGPGVRQGVEKRAARGFQPFEIFNDKEPTRRYWPMPKKRVEFPGFITNKDPWVVPIRAAAFPSSYAPSLPSSYQPPPRGGLDVPTTTPAIPQPPRHPPPDDGVVWKIVNGHLTPTASERQALEKSLKGDGHDTGLNRPKSPPPVSCATPPRGPPGIVHTTSLNLSTKSNTEDETDDVFECRAYTDDDDGDTAEEEKRSDSSSVRSTDNTEEEKRSRSDVDGPIAAAAEEEEEEDEEEEVSEEEVNEHVMGAQSGGAKNVGAGAKVMGEEVEEDNDWDMRDSFGEDDNDPDENADLRRKEELISSSFYLKVWAFLSSAVNEKTKSILRGEKVQISELQCQRRELLLERWYPWISAYEGDESRIAELVSTFTITQKLPGASEEDTNILRFALLLCLEQLSSQSKMQRHIQEMTDTHSVLGEELSCLRNVFAI